MLSIKVVKFCHDPFNHCLCYWIICSFRDISFQFVPLHPMGNLEDIPIEQKISTGE